MAAGFSSQDLDLLGYERAVELRTDRGWNAFRATATLGLETVESIFLYLKSDCQVDEARDASRFLQAQKASAYVLYPRSIKLVPTTIDQVFQSQKAKIFNLEELVWKRLSSIFRNYVSALDSGIPKEDNFVTPRQEGADAHTDLEKELVSYFEGKGSPAPGNLLVIKAPAGVGKTTLARHATLRLIKELDRYKCIPVFVESSHWRKLQLDSVDELWEIIQNSLQAFGSSSPIRKELFEYALRQGYLVFMFDGFDELCGHKSSNFDANQLLASIADIAASSDARIALTTRLLYWDSAISNAPKNAHVVELAAFNKQQASGYFEKVFRSNQQLQNKARELYEQVQRGSINPRTPGGGRAQFVNLPLCVVMIAELVKQQGLNAKAPSENVLEDLMLQICDRECERQNLRTPKNDQLSAFETLVCDRGFIREQNPEFEVDYLEMAGIAAEDVEAVKSHALLTSASGNRLRFKFEFLPSYLRAVALNRALRSTDGQVTSAYWELMANEANGKGYLIEHLFELIQSSNWREFIPTAVSRVPTHLPEAKSFLFHLARNLLMEDDKVVTRQDRTNELMALFCRDFSFTRKISNLTLLGQIHGLNFEGCQFEDCSFFDVSFLNTDADDKTAFRRCKFRGAIEFPETKPWKLVKLIEPRFQDAASTMCWETLLGQVQGSKIDSVTESIRYAFQKFWHNGHLKANLRKDDWQKGSLSHSPYKGDILEGMLRLGILTEEETSSVREGVLRFNRENLPELQRFMDNRQKTGVVLDLIEFVMKKV